MAGQDLVSTAAKALLRLFMASPRQERPLVTVCWTGLAPQPKSSQALGLAAAGADPLLMEYANSVRLTIAHVLITRVYYVCKWRRFSA